MGCGSSVEKPPPDQNGPAPVTEKAQEDTNGSLHSAPVGAAASPPPGDKPAHQAELIDGTQLAQRVLQEIEREVTELVAGGRGAPCLVVILVGSNPASLAYIKRKQDAAAQCGIAARVVRLEERVTEAALLQELRHLNSDDHVHGVIVQLPLPPHLDVKAVTGAISEEKDVDGFAAHNIGHVALNGHEPLFCPCTPKGCLRMIKETLQGAALRGKEAVVIGASNIVGIPMALLLLKEGCTVTTCHVDTRDTAAHARQADILVVACGVAGLVKKGWVKEGAIVIDVGINFVPDASKKSGKRMCGDVAFDEVATVAGHVSPVPGGVGPMTVAMLMQNTLIAKKHREARVV